MKRNVIKRVLSMATALMIAAVSCNAVVLADSVTVTPDTGAVGGISNGGEWSIYASHSAQLGINGYASNGNVTDGRCTVTGSANIVAAYQFDLSTMNSNTAKAAGEVIKEAYFRVTPVVTQGSDRSHALYVVGNNWDDSAVLSDEQVSQVMADKKLVIDSFTPARYGSNDFNNSTHSASIYGKTVSEIAEAGVYPEYLASWQNNLDVTGDVVAGNETISLCIESNEPASNLKTEYSNTKITANGRLTSGQFPFLLTAQKETTEYSKWIYPQLVFTYTDDAEYVNAYNDFVKLNSVLSSTTVTATTPLTVSPENGSTVTLEVAEDEILTASDNTISLNGDYVGTASSADVKLTVTNGNAVYTRIVPVSAQASVATYEISYNADKMAEGEVSLSVEDTVYTDGTGYAQAGNSFIVTATPNTGYSANVSVKTQSGTEISLNQDGTYTMPEENVTVEVEFVKPYFGTTRISATNSVSVKKDGTLGGNTSENKVTIAASRCAFFKFDLNNYDKDALTKVQMSFASANTSTRSTKVLFYVPNNNWTEDSMRNSFCLEAGNDKTRLNSFDVDGVSKNLFEDSAKAEIVKDWADGTSETDLSAASEGILKDYYLGAYSKDMTVEVTDAVKEAMSRSKDGIVTFMVYSPFGTGLDVWATRSAASLSDRPSLILTEQVSAKEAPEGSISLLNSVNNDTSGAREIIVSSSGTKKQAADLTMNNEIYYLGDYDISEISRINVRASMSDSVPQIKLAYMPVVENETVDANYLSTNSGTIRSAGNMLGLIAGTTVLDDASKKAQDYVGAVWTIDEEGVKVDDAEYKKFPQGTAAVDAASTSLNKTKTEGDVHLFLYAGAQSKRAVVDYVEVVMTEPVAPIPEGAVELNSLVKVNASTANVKMNDTGAKKTVVQSIANDAMFYVGDYDLSLIGSIDIRAAFKTDADGNNPEIKIAYMPIEEGVTVDEEYLNTNSKTLRSAENTVAKITGTTVLGEGTATDNVGAVWTITPQGVTVDAKTYANSHPNGIATADASSTGLNASKTEGKVHMFVYTTAQKRIITMDYIKVNTAKLSVGEAVETEDGNLSVKAEIVNPTAATGNATLITAVYGDNGLIAVGVNEAAVFDKIETYTVKAFLWNDLESLVPVLNAVSK